MDSNAWGFNNAQSEETQNDKDTQPSWCNFGGFGDAPKIEDKSNDDQNNAKTAANTNSWWGTGFGTPAVSDQHKENVQENVKEVKDNSFGFPKIESNADQKSNKSDDSDFDDFIDPETSNVNGKETIDSDHRNNIQKSNGHDHDESEQNNNLNNENGVNHNTEIAAKTQIQDDEDSFDDFKDPIDQNENEDDNRINTIEVSSEPEQEPIKVETEKKVENLEVNQTNSDEIQMKEDEDSFDDFKEPQTPAKQQVVENPVEQDIDLKDNQEISQPEASKAEELSNKESEIEVQSDDDGFDDFKEPKQKDDPNSNNGDEDEIEKVESNGSDEHSNNEDSSEEKEDTRPIITEDINNDIEEPEIIQNNQDLDSEQIGNDTIRFY